MQLVGEGIAIAHKMVVKSAELLHQWGSSWALGKLSTAWGCPLELAAKLHERVLGKSSMKRYLMLLAVRCRLCPTAGAGHYRHSAHCRGWALQTLYPLQGLGKVDTVPTVGAGHCGHCTHCRGWALWALCTL